MTSLNHTVMISHSSNDVEIVQKVIQYLSIRNINSWASFKHIDEGEDWPTAINTAIKNCEIFLLILTNDSNNSPHVKREIALADKLKKKFFCLQIDDLDISENIDYFFANIQRTLAYKTGSEIAFTKISDSIKNSLSSSLPIDEGDVYRENTKWSNILRKQTSVVFKEYLNKYPNGSHVVEAKSSIAALGQFESTKLVSPLYFPTLTTIESFNVFPKINISSDQEKSKYVARLEFSTNRFHLFKFGVLLDNCIVHRVFRDLDNDRISLSYQQIEKTEIYNEYFSAGNNFINDLIDFKFQELQYQNNSDPKGIKEHSERKITINKSIRLFLHDVPHFSRHIRKDKIIFFMVTIWEKKSEGIVGQLEINPSYFLYSYGKKIKKVKLIYSLYRDRQANGALTLQCYDDTIKAKVSISLETGEESSMSALETSLTYQMRKCFNETLTYSKKNLIPNVKNIDKQTPALVFKHISFKYWFERKDEAHFGDSAVLFVFSNRLILKMKICLVIDKIITIEYLDKNEHYDERLCESFIRIIYEDDDCNKYILLLYSYNIFQVCKTLKVYDRLKETLKDVDFLV